MIYETMLTALTVLAYVLAVTSAVLLIWFVFNPATSEDQRHKRVRRGAEVAMTAVIAGVSADRYLIAGLALFLAGLHLIAYKKSATTNGA